MTAIAHVAMSLGRHLPPARAVLLTLLGVSVAGCAQVGTNSFTFWDLFFGMIVFFFWVMFIWVIIELIGDVFRRDDIGGGLKALWILVLVIFPFIGALIYIAMRPKVTASDVSLMTRADAASKAVASVSTADELAKLQQLKDMGAITEAEFTSLKEKALKGAGI